MEREEECERLCKRIKLSVLNEDLGEGGNCGDSMCNIESLPAEMLDMILQLVLQTDLASALNARQVCHRWNSVIRPLLPFSGTLDDKTIRSLAELDIQIPLKCLVLKRLENSRVSWYPKVRTGARGVISYHPQMFQRSVEHLVVGGDAGIFLKIHGGEELQYSLSTGFAEEHKILPSLNGSISGLDLLNIVTQLKDVKTLTLSSVAFLSVSLKMLKKFPFQNFYTLTKLDICIGKRAEAGKMSLFLCKAEFPNLSSLYVRVYFSCMHFYLYICVYLFMARHRRGLKRLSFSQAQAFYAVPIFELLRPELSIASYPKLREELLEIKLEYMRMDCIVFGHPIGDPWKSLEREFVQNQSHLRGLELQLILRSMDCRLDELLPVCDSTLERLELSSNHFHPNEFDCRTISRFTNLKHCHLYMRNPLYSGDNNEVVKIVNIHMLPQTIVSLHLNHIPSIPEIRMLRDRLSELERISYGGGDGEEYDIKPIDILISLTEHLKFSKLVEFRIYQYSNSVVVDLLNKMEGLYCYIDDDDSLLVLVDRDEFDVEKMARSIYVVRPDSLIYVCE